MLAPSLLVAYNNKEMAVNYNALLAHYKDSDGKKGLSMRIISCLLCNYLCYVVLKEN